MSDILQLLAFLFEGMQSLAVIGAGAFFAGVGVGAWVLGDTVGLTVLGRPVTHPTTALGFALLGFAAMIAGVLAARRGMGQDGV